MLVTGIVVVACGGSAKRALTPEHCTAQTRAGAVDLDPEQARIATTILAVAIKEGLPKHAVAVAYTAAFQESKMHNLDYGDRDSVGVFQQRPSQGWGPRKRLLDPAYATSRFYAALVRVDGYQQMPLHVAAQHVQHSAYGPAYEQHEEKATVLTEALTGRAGGSAFTCLLRPDDGHGVGDVRAAVAHDWGGRAVRSTGHRGFVVRLGGNAPLRHTRAMAFWLVAHADAFGVDRVRQADLEWRSGDDRWRHAKATLSAHRVRAHLRPKPSPTAR